MTREQMAHEMRQAILDLLDEICAADGFDVRARDAGRRALETALASLLSMRSHEVNWAALDGMSAEQIRAVTREAMRPMVLRELAPMRPS